MKIEATDAYECELIYVHTRRHTQEDRSISKFNNLNSRLDYPLLTLETKVLTNTICYRHYNILIRNIELEHAR
jgi:hypothetical protein